METAAPDAEPAPSTAVRVMAALAILHLASVVLVVWVDLGRGASSAAGTALRTYQSLAGTMRDYSYFAPSVASDTKAGFLLEDESGAPLSLVSFASDNKEIAFRYDSMISACMREERGRDYFAQSWAASLLGAKPEAAQVTVMVKRLDMPTMARYREGQRAEWKLLYAGTFTRRSRPAAP